MNPRRPVGDPAASLMSAGTDHGIRHGDHPLSFFVNVDDHIVAAVSSIVHKTGDSVRLVVKAIHVLPVKE